MTINKLNSQRSYTLLVLLLSFPLSPNEAGGDSIKNAFKLINQTPPQHASNSFVMFLIYSNETTIQLSLRNHGIGFGETKHFSLLSRRKMNYNKQTIRHLSNQPRNRERE